MSNFVGVLRAEIAALEQALADDPRYVKLIKLRGVLALYDGEMKNRTDQNPHHIGAAVRRVNRPVSELRTKALEGAKLYLQNRSGPVTTREILEHLEMLNIAVPGTEPLNNLSAMLSNANEFVSHKRRGWTLRQEVGEDRIEDRSPLEADAQSKQQSVRLFDDIEPDA